MKLLRLRVENFRKFRQPYEIASLEAGLNLFVAPNESGKSTLTEAIKAAFFERSRSGSVEHLRPWGDSSATPTVELDFEWNSSSYRLVKSFLGKKRCDLTVNGSAMDGADAEDHLAALMGFQYPGRGASSPEHMGIPGLLWIRQGSSHELNEYVGHAGDHLRNALGSSVGEVAMNAGDQVIDALEAERGKLLTPSTHSPRGDYQAAQRRQKELQELIQSLLEQVNTYREGVDRLGRLRADHAQDEAEKPWEALRRQLAQATEKLAQARGLASTCEQARQQLTQTDIQVGALQGQHDNLLAQEALLQKRQARLLEVRGSLESRQSVLLSAQGRFAQAQLAHAEASQLLKASRLADRHQTLLASQLSLAGQLSRLHENLQKAMQLNQSVVDLAAKCQLLKVDRKAIQQVQKCQAEIANLQNRLDTVATSVEFDLLPGVQLAVKGQPLQGQARLNLFEHSEINIPAVGRLLVMPGGADLSQWAAQLQDRQLALQQLLQSQGVDSAGSLETRFQQFEAVQAELESSKSVLAVLAPQGLNGLQSECLALQSQLDGLKPQLPHAATSAPDVAVLPIHEAELKEGSARLAMEAAAEALQNARMDVSSAQAMLNEVQGEHAALEQRVAAADWALEKAAAFQKLQDALNIQQGLSVDLQRLLGALQALNIQVLEQDVKRLEQSAAQAESAYQLRLQQMSALEAELQTRGALGQEEQLANLQLELVQVSRRADEFSNRAAALTLLLHMLQEKRQELALKLQAPLQKHLQHYLNILWPGTLVELGEDLSIQRIQRNRASGFETGSFEELSMGAREQMGIVARLAYADLLKESMRPTLIVLDDALVHSDKDRLGQMKRVLFDAASRHQILVFSCHPEDWSDLGVQRRVL